MQTGQLVGSNDAVGEALLDQQAGDFQTLGGLGTGCLTNDLGHALTTEVKLDNLGVFWRVDVDLVRLRTLSNR